MTNQSEKLEHFIYAKARVIINDTSLTIDQIKQKLILELDVDPSYVNTLILEIKL